MVGDGTNISFWYDEWGFQTLAQTGTGCSYHAWSLQKALELIELPIELTGGQPNKLMWKYNSNEVYSTKSIYHTLVIGDCIKWEFSSTWRFSVPYSVMIFLFLLLKDKLLMRNSMLHCQFHCIDASCLMCTSGTIELAFHLFFQCHHSLVIWNMVRFCSIARFSVLVLQFRKLDTVRPNSTVGTEWWERNGRWCSLQFVGRFGGSVTTQFLKENVTQLIW